MGQLGKLALFVLVLMAVLHNSSGGKTGGKSTPSKKPSNKPSQGTKTQSNYPRQPSNPGAGSNPGYPNQQHPGRDTSGSYSSAGGNTNWYPGRGGSRRGGVNPGGYPNQNPAGGGYSNQYPGRSGYSPGGYPPGGYPGGHPSIGGGYPNWNPENKILSPRYGGSFGGGRFGTGGSPFSNTVKSMGYGPSAKSKGFAKKAMLAAGIGAVAGMAVGYGIGNFPRPNFQFRSPQEERQYNHYMYARQGTHSKDRNNKGRPNYTSKQPSQAQSYEQYMSTCMKRKDLLKEQDTTDSADRKNIQRDEPLTDIAAVNDTTSPITVNDYPKAAAIREDDDDTVSIMQIGYPALIEQMKSRKCVELYLVYSESFTENFQILSFKKKIQTINTILWLFNVS
uniref:Interleukin enhancer-binding factor 3-like n=1 Tax=Sinocyclocheilus rhinocerous TaxID=307959 RepID=A0A673L3G7_9TELE